MERALTLTDTAARHPLRRALAITETPGDRWENTRLFLMTFVAGFLAFYGMIA